MNATPGHDELVDLLPAAALESLDETDLRRVQDHAQQCTECAQLLQEYREAAATMALGLASHPLDAGRSSQIRRRLLARAQAHPPLRVAGKDTTPRQRSPWSVPAAYGWAGWMVAAGLAGVVLVHHSVHRPVAYGWFVAGALTIVLVVLGVYARQQRNRALALRKHLDAVERDPMQL